MNEPDKQQSDAALPEGLVGINGLAKALWPDESERPALRTLRKWTARKVIPSLKIGSLRFYEPARVKAALRKKFEIPAAE